MRLVLFPIIFIVTLVLTSCARDVEVEDVPEQNKGGGCAMCKSEQEKSMNPNQ